MCNFDTLFLDRDGVINRKLDGRYVRNFSEFDFVPGAVSALSRLSNIFKRVLIITNQQGIGKGIMTDFDLKELHFHMQYAIEQSGGRIDKVYYCPHLVELNCNCRKPKVGMIEQAIIDFPEISIKNSYLVGDSDSDIEAGTRMNLHTIKVNHQYTLAKWVSEFR